MKIKVFANELFSPYFDTETKQITCDKISNCFVCPVIKQFSNQDFDCVEFIINKLIKEGLI